MNVPLVILVVALVLLSVIRDSTQASLEDELSLTSEQKQRLDKFRRLMENRLPHDYMKEDIYLVRWLRARNFNLAEAQKLLLDNLRWRAENDMDNILNEDWTDFDREYRINVEGCDKQGRPIASLYIGDWDIRKAVVAGHSQKLMRYLDKLLEEATMLIRHLQARGENVTQLVEIYEMSNFNIAQHGCPQCIAIYAYIFTSFERHYPGVVHKSTSVNVPSYLHTVYQLLSPLLSAETRSLVSLYGKDRKQWEAALQKEISPNQLTYAFGGLKADALEMQEIRERMAKGELFQCPKNVQ